MISKSQQRLFKVHWGQNNQKRRWNKDIWLCRIRGADDSASSRHAGVRDQQLAHSQEHKTINNSKRTKGQIFGRRAPVVYIWGLGEGGSPTEGREAPTHGQNVRVQGGGDEEDRARGARAKTITRFTAPVESVSTRHSQAVNAMRQSRRSSSMFHFLSRPLLLVPFGPSGTFCSRPGQICS